MNISFIIPSRENLKYLKWCYAAIRKNQGNHTVQICVADDASTDGTKEWCESVAITDSHFDFIVNDSGQRVGHTILYDRLVNEVAKYDLCIIFHADMYLCPGALDAIEKHMYHELSEEEMQQLLEETGMDALKLEPRKKFIDQYKIIPVPKTIVSLTRIEPPLHPPGPEKIVVNCGTEPENFNEDVLLKLIHSKAASHNKGITTRGVFAPWAFWKNEFQEIGGHDELFKPQSKEDSDIFNRYMLFGVNFIQTWEGFVYHLTCRGSRYNPTLTVPGKDSDEWSAHNIKSARNFIRKWGNYVEHDEYMLPIVSPKYDVCIIVEHAQLNLIGPLEPWCSKIHVDMAQYYVNEYIQKEQPNTLYNLTEKIICNEIGDAEISHGVVVRIDGHKFTQQDFTVLQSLPKILKEQAEVGETYKLGNLTVKVNDLTDHVNSLIINNRDNNELVEL